MDQYFKPFKVMIFGGGGLGSNAARQLVQSGFEHITVMEPDTVREENKRHGYPTSMIGLPKVVALERILKDLSPALEYQGLQQAVTKAGFPQIRRMLRDQDVGVALFDDFAVAAALLSEFYREPPWVHAHERNTGIADICLSVPGMTPCIPCVTNLSQLQSGHGRDASPDSFAMIAAIVVRFVKALCLQGQPAFNAYRHYLRWPLCRVILNQYCNPVLRHRRADIPLYLQHVNVRAGKLPSCPACQSYLTRYRRNRNGNSSYAKSAACHAQPR